MEESNSQGAPAPAKIDPDVPEHLRRYVENEIGNARAFYERILEDELREILSRAAVIRRVLNKPEPGCKHCRDCRRCKNCPDR